MEFDIIFEKLPESLKVELLKTKHINEKNEWHPEESLFIHIKTVYGRLVKFNDINLLLSALIHDLGKIDTFQINEFGRTSAYGHEFSSIKYLKKYKNWIKEIGGNYDIIFYIVSNHMRVKYISNMKKIKINDILTHKHFKLLNIFQSADKGGDDINEYNELIKIKNYEYILKENKKFKLEFKKIVKKFYIKGKFFLPKNKYYIISLRKPYLREVNENIKNGKKKEIKL